MDKKTELVIFKAQDGNVKLDVKLEDETVWLTQNQMSELFARDRSVITKHIKNIFKENEVDEISIPQPSWGYFFNGRSPVLLAASKGG